MKSLQFTITAMILALASSGIAQVIDFETVPGGAGSVDNATLGLTDGYPIGAVTITFGFDINSDGTPETEAVFEQIGDADGSPSGFSNECLGSVRDTADAGFEAQLGGFFLRQPTSQNDFGQLVIDYSGSGVVTAASGEIWDIDGAASLGSEKFRVQAFDSANNLLATDDSPEYAVSGCGAALDGEPWVFQFSGLSAGISRITVDFVGTKTAFIGLAFNNFDALGVTVAVEETVWGDVKVLYK